MYTHQTLVNLHVSARYRYDHQGVLPLANVAPSKSSVSKEVRIKTNLQLDSHWNIQIKH